MAMSPRIEYLGEHYRGMARGMGASVRRENGASARRITILEDLPHLDGRGRAFSPE
jgi:hypothetical protein